jgi:hypothetical protein
LKRASEREKYNKPGLHCRPIERQSIGPNRIAAANGDTRNISRILGYCMVDYLTYYYSTDTVPFRSLSELPDGEAMRIMKELHDQYGDNILFARFADPAQYLNTRRQTEEWVRSSFLIKGGQPVDSHPISMVLGSSKWIENNAPDRKTHGGIRIPLSAFSEGDVSFTFPDSMVSWWLSHDKPGEYFLPEYHGKVFLLSEILAIVRGKGMPEDDWKVEIPKDTGAYIEAQVWNRKILEKYIPGG